MSTGYDPKSCNALQKPFYRPVEVAIRWCGLIAHEATIMGALDPATNIPTTGQFPNWPCLQANTEKVLYAMLSGELPYGRDGKPVASGESVRRDRMTVTHSNLKAWFKATQEQKPSFLFDEVERAIHPGITLEVYQRQGAELDAAKSEVKRLREKNLSLTDQVNSLAAQLESATAAAKAASDDTPQGRRRNSNLLRIIAALDRIAKLPERGPGQSVALQLAELFGESQEPGAQTVEKVLREAREAVENDGIPSKKT